VEAEASSTAIELASALDTGGPLARRETRSHDSEGPVREAMVPDRGVQGGGAEANPAVPAVTDLVRDPTVAAGASADDSTAFSRLNVRRRR
jgi:hypothetical protein